MCRLIAEVLTHVTKSSMFLIQKTRIKYLRTINTLIPSTIGLWTEQLIVPLPSDEKSRISDNIHTYSHMSLLYEFNSVFNSLGHVTPHHYYWKPSSAKRRSSNFVT